MTVRLTDRASATVLAALRCWQQALAANTDNIPICPDHFDDTITPLTLAEIDNLCERINTGDTQVFGVVEDLPQLQVSLPHSPLPWRPRGSLILDANGDEICAVLWVSQVSTLRADVDLIVQAVNNHAELLAACQATAFALRLACLDLRDGEGRAPAVLSAALTQARQRPRQGQPDVSATCLVLFPSPFSQGVSTMLNATIEGKELVIRVPLNATPVLSTSGKTLVVASSHGNQQTEARVNGQPVIVGVNAYIYRQAR